MPALRGPRQEDPKFQVSLSYKAKPYCKANKFVKEGEEIWGIWWRDFPCF
jgi:hypothetical protein